ncbi:MAG: pyruvate kinase [Gammaproteobacteria bacterium]|nr:pyruvate kinase [Gammaproteobacteria bacterium]
MPSRPTIRRTKIVATIGPACDDLATLKAMIDAGMNVARLNFSHGDVDQHARRLERVREAAKARDAFVATMIDTRGVEVRTGQLAESSVKLESGQPFRLYADGREGDAGGVGVTYARLAHEVRPGECVLIDDGALELRAESRDGDDLVCRVVVGGTLHPRKSINLPDSTISLGFDDPVVHRNTVEEIEFAVAHEVDYIAASFIQSAGDVQSIRRIQRDHDAKIPIIAKIESRRGVDNLETIVTAANGTMVARGDLGVELPLAEVPGTQKRIIRTTVYNGKPVITATQMLDSMERNPKPTRAEASDVANAILDGTSAAMLSGETAMGRYPVEAVATMAALALKAESYLGEYGHLQKSRPNPANVITEAVGQAAVQMAAHLGARAIVSLTTTGFTSRLVSKHRPECPILAVTESPLAARRLAMNWGIIPYLCPPELADHDKIAYAIAEGRARGLLADGDLLVATAGYHQQPGTTDQIRVITLQPGEAS